MDEDQLSRVSSLTLRGLPISLSASTVTSHLDNSHLDRVNNNTVTDNTSSMSSPCEYDYIPESVSLNEGQGTSSQTVSRIPTGEGVG